MWGPPMVGETKCFPDPSQEPLHDDTVLMDSGMAPWALSLFSISYPLPPENAWINDMK